MARIKVRQFKWFVCCEPDFCFRPMKGVVYWVPKIVKFEVVNGRWVDVGERLFFDYFFIGTYLEWYRVEYDLGIELLRVGDKPHCLTKKEIDQIKVIEKSQRWVCCGVFNVGQRIVVKDTAKHPFAGLAGVFVQRVPVCGGEHAKIEINLFGHRRTVTQLPLDYIESV